MISSGDQGKNHVTKAERKREEAARKRNRLMTRSPRVLSWYGERKEPAIYNTERLICGFFHPRNSWSSKCVCKPSLTVGSITNTYHDTHTRACELGVFWNVQNLEVTPSSNTPELLRSKTCTGPAVEKKAQTGTLGDAG